MTTLHWFRDDLRLHDNPALTWAASRGEVIACVLDEPTYPGSRPSGSATSWWRERSLSCLAEELASYNVPLYRLNGDARTTIPAFAKSQNVSAVCWNRRYHLSTIDAVLKESLHSQGLEIHSFAAHTLVEPQAVKPYKVYSAFARAARAVLQNTLQPALEVPDLHGPGAVAWEEASAPAWAASLAKHWTPGEEAARKTLAELDLSDYDKGRDFAWHRLYHVPDLATEPVREKFRNFDWYWDDGGIDTSGKDPRPHPLPELQAWRTGETGIPLVDAGMRELWQTGYMHNRVRMVVGSFLTKNLGIHWRHGEEWFWDTLVDADPASNPFNWQWVAGCGDDASPFFRIFNPQLQASKFDPGGTYMRQWAPPLSPPPIVDLKQSRQAALDAYQEIR
ncbi:deoxyribodipyrimidine photo-lyase [Corynebacterium striatum]|uniref:cryptochrome/photolyase family protein n=1 Tax=Corynebacterium striatum TaxID=43770 RepID=UPI00191DCD3C|nr:deoxyribodipyrimidine photo-lyase [Corynebacterium striatum]QQU80502.1 deoxyribodipyrimidine photo-lyase [Corynebacterium striatum]